MTAAARQQALDHLTNGQPALAEAVLTEALRGLPAGPADVQRRPLQMLHARVAAIRGDYATARERWRDLARRYPADAAIQQALCDIEALRLPEVQDETPVPSPHSALMWQFEGLGGTCEFGLVQRHFGAEPLGLFRWAGVNMVNLCKTLDTDLDGIGQPRTTRIYVTEAGDFDTADSEIGLNMHTFIVDTGQDRDKLLAQMRRRMRFLRDKLIEDLRDGHKIFVYRHVHAPEDAPLLRLLTAIRRYHPANRLLVVRCLAHGDPCEPVRVFAPGAAVCGIGNGRKPGRRAGWAIDTDAWLQSLQDAAGLLPAPQGALTSLNRA